MYIEKTHVTHARKWTEGCGQTTDRHSGFRRSGFRRSGLDIGGLDVQGWGLEVEDIGG